MKVQSFDKPTTIEAVGNGSYRYRWNIDKIISTNEENRDFWLWDEVIIPLPLTSNRITKAVIEEMWDSSYEQKLINEYNAAQLGVYDADKAAKKIEEYKSFLEQREKVKEEVDEEYRKWENWRKH